MDEGFFQLIFIGVLVLASIFDASTRKRRRQQRQQRMEEREAEEGEEAGALSREADSRSPSARSATTTRRPSEQSEGRGSADSMIPADLWEVMTGEQRAPGGRRETERGRATSETRVPEDTRSPSGFERKRTALPPSEPWELSAPPVPKRAPEPEPSSPTTEPAWATAEGSYEPYTEPYTPPPPVEEAPLLPVETWPSLHPSAPPIGAPLTPVPPVRPAPSGPKSRPGAGAYADLLRSGGPDSLRAAVVLKEILGSPTALRRRPKGGWEPT